MLLRSPATQDSEGKEGKEIGLARSPGPRGAQNGEACTHLPARAALSPREGRSEGEIISVPILCMPLWCNWTPSSGYDNCVVIQLFCKALPCLPPAQLSFRYHFVHLWAAASERARFPSLPFLSCLVSRGDLRSTSGLFF